MNTRLHLLWPCFIICIASLGKAVFSDPPYYTVTKLGDLPPPQISLPTWGIAGRWITHAYGLNDRGQVVGGSNGDAFLWENGHMTGLGLYEPPDQFSEDPVTAKAMAINNKGSIVGDCGHNFPIFMSGMTDRVGFIYKDKRIAGGMGSILFSINNQGEAVGLEGFRGLYGTTARWLQLDTTSKRPAGNGSIAMAINDKGQFVGATTVDVRKAIELPLHAFLWIGSKRHGKMKDLGTLPSFPYSIATSVNNQGEVVGYVGKTGWGRYCYVQEPTHAFLWRKGKMTDLGLLPGTNSSQVDGINNAGQIIGKSGDRATLWAGGKPYDLNTLLETPVSPPLREATGINNHGQIICNTGAGAYLLTPIN